MAGIDDALIVPLYSAMPVPWWKSRRIGVSKMHWRSGPSGAKLSPLRCSSAPPRMSPYTSESGATSVSWPSSSIFEFMSK